MVAGWLAGWLADRHPTPEPSTRWLEEARGGSRRLEEARGGSQNQATTMSDVVRLKQQAATNAASFNTDRDTTGVRPGKLLEEKEKGSLRRSR